MSHKDHKPGLEETETEAVRESDAERHRKLARMAALKSIMKEAESTGTILVSVHLSRIVSCGFA
jgi:hypothetical protein